MTDATLTVSDPQEGWLEAFNAIAAEDGDGLLMDNIENDFDKDEWIW